MESYSDFEELIKGKDFEGEILHMYQDSKGLVTAGVGNYLASVEEAQKLPFIFRSTKKPASKEEIRTDYDNVKNAPKNLRAEKYKQYTSLELESTVSRDLLKIRVRTFVRELRHNFSNFEDLPRPTQLGLLDLAFNCGTKRLVTHFPNLKKAIEENNWAKAAVESHRTNIGNKRNETIKNWFHAARKIGKKM